MPGQETTFSRGKGVEEVGDSSGQSGVSAQCPAGPGLSPGSPSSGSCSLSSVSLCPSTQEDGLEDVEAPRALYLESPVEQGWPEIDVLEKAGTLWPAGLRWPAACLHTVCELRKALRVSVAGGRGNVKKKKK